MEFQLQERPIFTSSTGVLRLKGYVYCPDSNEELAVLSTSNCGGIGGSETLYYPSDYAKGLIQNFDNKVGRIYGTESIEQPASDSIESLAVFRSHSSSRQGFKGSTSNLLKKERWFELFKTLVDIAAFGGPLEVIISTKKVLSFMRFQAMNSFDQSEAYKSEFLMNFSIAWKFSEEGLKDVTNICRLYASKIMLLLTPASEWLDLSCHSNDYLDSTTLAHYSLGQQTLYFTKKLGSLLLHPREATKARLLSYLCSTKLLGHPGSLVDEAELASSMGRSIILRDYKWRNNIKSMLSMYEPSDFLLENTMELEVDMSKGSKLDRKDARKLTSYVWNNLMFSSNERSRRDIGAHGVSSQQVNALVGNTSPAADASEESNGEDDENPDACGDEESEGSPPGLTKDQGSSSPKGRKYDRAVQFAKEKSRISDTTPLLGMLADDHLGDHRKSALEEAYFSCENLRAFYAEAVNYTKNTTLDVLTRKKTMEMPYPKVGIDVAYEKFIVGRRLNHVSCSDYSWKFKNCGICGGRDPPVNKEDQNGSRRFSCMQTTIVCSECTRPFHQSCARSLYGDVLQESDRPCILMGDVQYVYTCADCAIMARFYGRLPFKISPRPNADNLLSRQRTLLDAAIIAVSILTVEFNYKFVLFDIRQVWDTIKRHWKELQPLVLLITDTKNASMFLGLEDERSIARLDKKEAKTRLLTMLRSHPAFYVKEGRAGNFAFVGFSKKFRSLAFSLLPPQNSHAKE